VTCQGTLAIHEPIYKIPTEVHAYPEGEPPPDTGEFDALQYETRPGDLARVILWGRWPSYDFIFGVPDPSSLRYAKEVGFFQFRDARAKQVQVGCYVDIEELLAAIKGFEKIRSCSETHSRELWKKL
jgi:hypothetical protein